MQSSSEWDSLNGSFDTYPFIGAGNLGYWGKDGEGKPCYHLDTQKKVKQDIWHLIGNDRISATAHAKGYVQIYAWDRGPQILNHYDIKSGMTAGGYSWIISDKTQLCTYFDNILDINYEMVWGCGYVQKRINTPLWYIEETVFAPDGKDAVLIHELKVKNISLETQNLRIIPVWEPNWLPIDPGLIMTPPYDRFWYMLRGRRGKKVQHSAEFLSEKDILVVRFFKETKTKKKNSWRVIPIDNFFICSLNEHKPEQFFINKNDLEKIIYLNNYQTEKDKKLTCNLLSFVEEQTLEAGKEITLKYLVGYGTIEEIADYKKKYLNEANILKNKKYIAVNIPDIKMPLDRELRWHSYYLQAGCVYSEYHNRYFVDQGSAYGFIHGASGAPRDWAFFIVPLIYLRHDLAREMILFLCQLQDEKTGKLPYALVGNGKTTGAGVHSWSSDLDLFFLWAIAEYLGATFDVGLLHEEVPFRNMNDLKRVEVAKHVEKAFYHLKDKVGIGKHGLIRSGTGDWNDVFLAFSPFPPITMLKGESVFNSAMAKIILPEIAQWVEAWNPSLAEQMRIFAQKQKEALQNLWNGKWFPRGYTGIGDRKLGEENLFLDVQPFVLLANLLSDEEQERLMNTIKEKCIDTQSFGATCLVPPMQGKFLEPGSDTNGGVWHAINAWLTWAWSVCNPQQAWEFLIKSMLFTHAEVYPHIWYGIWSGPDAYNSAEHPRAGETFCLNFTPMTKFPIMNMNCHAGILFAVLKILGLCPKNKTLFIDPKVPFEKFSLQTPLISYFYQPNKIELRYMPVCSGSANFSIKLNKNIFSSPEKIVVLLNGKNISEFKINETGFLILTIEIERDSNFSLDITI